MSQQSNRKSVLVYNYDPKQSHTPLQDQPSNVQQSKVVNNDDTPLNISKQLKFKQQQSNIFNLPDNQLLQYSQVQPKNQEKILPYEFQWWNSQLLKENKKSKEEPQQQETQQPSMVQQQNTPQIQNSSKPPQHPPQNPFQVIDKHNQLIHTGTFAQNLSQVEQQTKQSSNIRNQQLKTEPQVQLDIPNISQIEKHFNNPNIESKLKNRQFSDVLGGQLEKYYEDHQPKQAQPRRDEKQMVEESQIYGPQYHQRQMLRGMSSAFDTHNYYNQMLEQQDKNVVESKQQKCTSKSNQNSPGKELQQDLSLFPQPIYTQLNIRGLPNDMNWDKLNKAIEQSKLLLVDVQIIKDKKDKVAIYQIIIKHFNNNLAQIKQWVLGQGGRIIVEQNIPSEAEFLKLMKLKEIPKVKPMKIADEQKLLKSKRPQSAVQKKK